MSHGIATLFLAINRRLLRKVLLPFSGTPFRS